MAANTGRTRSDVSWPLQFKKGHTVSVLKGFLEDEYDLPRDLLVRPAKATRLSAPLD